IGNATKHGFLVKEGDALERLSQAKYLAFDKTGTLTYGTPRVTAVESCSVGFSAEEVYKLAASAEQFSEHPLGKAIASDYKREHTDTLLEVTDFQMIPGRGISAVAGGKKLLAGNVALLNENGIFSDTMSEADPYLQSGCTVTYLAVDGGFCGYIALSDTVREESSKMVDSLSALGVQTILLTGDHKNATNTIAKKAHIKEVEAEQSPEGKLHVISRYQEGDNPICMVGDGINDAPALKMAEVGIAMGGIGSDIAVEAADIALVNDEVKEIPHLIALSKRMMTTIKGNLSFSMTLNFVAIILAMIGTLNPVIGALVHNAGSVLVILNSALLLKWKKREKGRKNNCP
ncbi:MAG TPA: HAD-IC family P-type ATPase, partial [Clostridiales bacterium]|nr:HAD-IC family P-type ATPase [Clostridiales bacterium]